MPLEKGATVLHPEFAVLYWKDWHKTVDIGQLCYLRRDTSGTSRKRHVWDQSSLDVDRIRAVRKLIGALSDGEELSGAASGSAHLRARMVVRFVTWADNQGWHQVLCDKGSTEQAYREYVRFLRERVAQNRLNKNSAAGIQRETRIALEGYFEIEEFGADVRQLRFSEKHVNNTTVPDRQSQSVLLHWCTALFEALSKHVLEFDKYPLAVDGLDPKTGDARRVGILPTLEPTKTGEGWNYDTGEVRGYWELRTLFGIPPESKWNQRAWSARRRALLSLRVANEDHVAPVRLAHASLAASCFAMMFLAETGVNFRQMSSMNWSSELEEALRSPSVVRQQFREVKYRAAGKVVTFQVTLGFLPKLKTYLRLREYLVQDKIVSNLFVALKRDGKPAGLGEFFMSCLMTRIAGLGLDLPRVTPRQWRAAKQDWLLVNHGPDVAAALLGHTLETARRSYSNGTETAQRAEMSAFFASVERTVLRAGDRNPGTVETGVGGCAALDEPKPIYAGAPAQPDCRSSEGCLFCEKYRVHADATDIRKLLSCRHCVRLTSNSAPSFEDYDATFGVVLRRIDFLLDELRTRNGPLVDQIEEDVDVNGTLSPFWSGKLELLLELGLA